MKSKTYCPKCKNESDYVPNPYYIHICDTCGFKGNQKDLLTTLPITRPKPAAKPPSTYNEMFSKCMMGWICPVCGSGLSLTTSRCPCVPLKMEVTCNV